MSDSLNGKQVLIVEDSPTQLIHWQALLESNGLSCILADNGLMGLNLGLSMLPDAIILDLEMPQMNGFQVFQKLRANPNTANIPVILLSRFHEAEFFMLGQDLGAVEYIPKDAFAGAILVETLKQMDIIAS